MQAAPVDVVVTLVVETMAWGSMAALMAAETMGVVNVEASMAAVPAVEAMAEGAAAVSMAAEVMGVVSVEVLMVAVTVVEVTTAGAMAAASLEVTVAMTEALWAALKVAPVEVVMVEEAVGVAAKAVAVRAAVRAASTEVAMAATEVGAMAAGATAAVMVAKEAAMEPWSCRPAKRLPLSTQMAALLGSCPDPSRSRRARFHRCVACSRI